MSLPEKPAVAAHVSDNAENGLDVIQRSNLMDKAPMHTPPPWDVTKGKPRKITANGVLICNAVLRNMATTAQNKNGKGEDEAKANARLIAAAPELLQVANKAFDFLGGVDGAAEIRAELMAAIAKATQP
jgi:hypothetical protein